MNQLLFVYPDKASFIKMDIRILSNHYSVVENTYRWKKKRNIPFYLIHQFFFLLFNARKFEAILVSFGGYWAFLPVWIGKLYKRPVYIILHGTDSCDFKEISYGNLGSPILKRVLKYAYSNASGLLPVSESLIYTENTYYDPERPIPQGINHFFKTKTPKTVIPNAIDAEKWPIINFNDRPPTCITVMSEGQWLRKGGDLIVEVAKLLPSHSFIFVGIQKPENKALPDNVQIYPKTTPEELIKLYNEARYYLQLSIFEGFGVALCEAMLSGCTPVVARVNAMPEIIGNCGSVLNYRDAQLLRELIMDAENKFPSPNLPARERIIQEYSVTVRENLLISALKSKSLG